MVIAEIHPDTEKGLADSINKDDIVAIIELKFTCGGDIRTADWIRHDVSKLKNYFQVANIECQYYFAVIYEVECASLNWMDKRSSNHWASGYVTELDAGFIDGKMKFEVHSYNGLNKSL